MKVIRQEVVPIEQHISSQLSAQIAENQQSWHPYLRGHRECSDSKNPGIFKSLLQFCVDSGDEVLQQHFQSGARNAQYTSKGIQNDLIKIIGNHLESILLGKIKNGSKIFSILADDQGIVQMSMNLTK